MHYGNEKENSISKKLFEVTFPYSIYTMKITLDFLKLMLAVCTEKFITRTTV